MLKGVRERDRKTRALSWQSISPPVLGSKSACRNLDGKSGKVTLVKLRNQRQVVDWIKIFRCEDVDEVEKAVTSALPLYGEDALIESCACDQPPL